MSYGISATGFNRKTLQNCMDEVAAEYRATIGEVNDADDSVFSQVIRPLMTQVAEGWEALEAVYQSGSVNGAVGESLDNLVGINFITRLPAQPTLVIAAITGDVGTTVPSGNRGSLSETGGLFEATEAVTIDASISIKVTITVSTAVISTAYTVTLDGTAYTITSATAVAASIAAQLVAAIEAGALYTVVDALDGTFTVTTLDVKTPFTAAVGSRLALSDVTCAQAYASVETGPIACPTGSLDTIENAVSGFTRISNFQDGTLGRNLENDTELRTRRIQTLAISGKGTVASILAKLLSGEVPGITQAFVYENILDETDAYSRPAHSIECVVEGGDDTAIATLIHNNRAGGIRTFGNVNSSAGISIVDVQGFAQVVKFSRPVPKYAWVRVTYSLYDEEIFPSDGEGQIAARVLALGETHTIGKDFFQQRFIAPCVGVPGVGRVVVEIATTTSFGGSPSYAETDITVGQSELLVFDSTHIEVVPD